MFEEDDRPRRGQRFTPASFDGWSIGDLEAYVAALKVEIGRAEAAMAAGDAKKRAAEAFFRKP